MKTSIFKYALFSITLILGAPISGELPQNTHQSLSRSKSTLSGNWAGVILEPPAGNETFVSVGGQFVVPVPKLPESADHIASGSWSAAIWAGIDGVSPDPGLLQAGVVVSTVKSSTSAGSQLTTSYYAWYEWVSDAMVPIPASLFSINAGDEIQVTIFRSSSNFTSGTVVLTNLRTHQTFKKNLNAPDQESALVGRHVEWIVEDFSITSGGRTGLTPFLDIGTVEFKSLKAGATDNTALSLADSEIVNLVLIDNSTGKPEENVVTNTTLSGKPIRIDYIG